MRVLEPERLRRWRKAKGYTQQDLAFLCRCTQNTISLLERGDMGTLSNDLAHDIAKRLGVPWEDLFEARERSGVRRSAHGASSVRDREKVA